MLIRSQRKPNKGPIEVNLTPLIDVVFLLLIFFMVSTTFTKESRLMLELPDATGEPAAAIESMEISVSANAEYAIDGRPLVDGRLPTLLSAIAKSSDHGTGQPVVLTADENAPHYAVVKLLDALGQLGFSNIQITTRTPKG